LSRRYFKIARARTSQLEQNRRSQNKMKKSFA